MVEPRFEYAAEVVRVVDGDTMDLLIDLGFKVSVKERVRLYGIDTPETYGVKRDSEEYAAGSLAKNYVLGWLSNLGDRVVIRSHNGKALGTGKYGRWIVEVFPASGEGTSLNEELVSSGNAKYVTY
jgi:micrococcal nuclease